MKNIFEIILTIILTTILIICLLINVFSAFNLSFFGIRFFKISSGSMQPSLKVNDIVVTNQLKDYKEGDIVTFWDEGNFYTIHRIIKVDGEKVITKGDSNNTEDISISKDRIIGKVIYKFDVLGFLNYLFTQPISWILLVLFISLYLTYYSIRNSSESEMSDCSSTDT